MLDDIDYMRMALAEAKLAYDLGEVPIGAVIVDSVGKIIIFVRQKKMQQHMLS